MRESEVPCLIIVGPTPHKVFLIASAKQLLPFFHSFFLSPFPFTTWTTTEWFKALDGAQV